MYPGTPHIAYQLPWYLAPYPSTFQWCKAETRPIAFSINAFASNCNYSVQHADEGNRCRQANQRLISQDKPIPIPNPWQIFSYNLFPTRGCNFIGVMEYLERHGHDVCSFDLPSTRTCAVHPLPGSTRLLTMPQDRLPTVSAAQALDELDGDASRQVSTSLPDLDRALTGSTSGSSTGNDEKGGIQKSQVTEIWGPPGIGKTTLG